MKIRKSFEAILLLAALFILLFGVKNFNAQPRVGDWSCPTEFGQFMITVSCQGDCITDIIYTFDGFSCGGVTISGSIHSSSTPSWQIIDNHFSIQNNLDPWGNQKITVEGTFNQAGNEVSGEWVIDISGSICSGEWGPIISFVEVDENIPNEFILFQNFPNPFNPETTIKFGLPGDSHVRLVVYNLLGEEVAVLKNGDMAKGYHQLKFDASSLSSGLYLYQLNADNFRSTKKMLLLR